MTPTPTASGSSLQLDVERDVGGPDVFWGEVNSPRLMPPRPGNRPHVKRPSGYLPREPIPGMPDDLADAIYLLEEHTRDAALENWASIGERGQTAYRQYLDRARLRRRRRERCELAAWQLVAPDRPLPTPDGGGGG